MWSVDRSNQGALSDAFIDLDEDVIGFFESMGLDRYDLEAVLDCAAEAELLTVGPGDKTILSVSPPNATLERWAKITQRKLGDSN